MKILNRSAFSDAINNEVQQRADEFQQLRTEDAERIQRMKDYRTENEMSRDADIFGQVADTTDYGNQKTNVDPSRHNIPLPFGLAAGIKHGFRIFGRLPDALVDRREETERERYRSDTMEKLVWSIIRASGDKTLFKDAAWDGSHLGASCFDLYFDDKKQLPVIRSIDPTGVMVVPGLENVHDFERVYRFWEVSRRSLQAAYGGKLFRDYPIPTEALKQDTCVLVQVADKQGWMRFVVDGFDAEDDLDAMPLEEHRHGLGLVPYIVVPNIGPEREPWGWADYELIRGLVHYIPTLFSREADMIRMVSGGSFIEKGTGQSPSRILSILRKGGVIPSKRDGTVEPISAPDVPDFEQDHAQRALQMMKMLGFLPDAAWGDGAAGSGSDRGLQLQPLLELTEMKQANWSSGLARLFECAFRMMEQKQLHRTQYSGSVQKGQRRVPFILPEIGPTVEDATIETGFDEETGEPTTETLPRTLKGLFAGDYAVRFVWQNRIDPDDPAFVNSELAKFQQGAQSLRTTLENLGVQNPEDEIKIIEQEAERIPWLRQGQIALIKAQLDAERAAGGDEGGRPADPATGLFNASDSFAETDTVATDADLAGQALPGQSGPLYGSQ